MKAERQFIVEFKNVNNARISAVFEKIYPLDFDPEEQTADLKAWQA